jgi:hypothetical protein
VIENPTKIVTHCSVKTRLSFANWRYEFKARLGLLPVERLSGSTTQNQQAGSIEYIEKL